MDLHKRKNELQKINPENLTLFKVYNAVSEAISDSNNELKRPSINQAVVERDQDANIVNVQPTKETQTQTIGYIAKINADKTAILNVYLNRYVASLSNGYESPGALDQHVKNYTCSRNHYYRLYQHCPTDLIETFEGVHGPVILYKNGIGKFDLNGCIIKEFVSKMDCYERQDEPSNKTLTKSISTNKLYGNYFYRCIPEKLQVLA